MSVVIKSEHEISIPVLAYHHIIDGDIKKSDFYGNDIVISKEAFQEQIEYLYNEGYYTASLDELESFLYDKIKLPSKTVVITFDDGYKSNLIFAYPILKKYKFKAAVFIIGEFTNMVIDKTTNLEYIKFTDIKCYEDVFQFANHTYDLHKIEMRRPVLITKTKEDIKNDILKLKNIINSRYFAYPYGSYNKLIMEVLYETGFKLAFTVDKGYVNQNSLKFELPRILISQKTTLQKFDKLLKMIE